MMVQCRPYICRTVSTTRMDCISELELVDVGIKRRRWVLRHGADEVTQMERHSYGAGSARSTRGGFAACCPSVSCKLVGTVSNVLAVRVFLLLRKNNVSPDTCVAVGATLNADVPAFVIRFWCAAAAEMGSHKRRFRL